MKHKTHIEVSRCISQGRDRRLTKCGIIVDQNHINNWVPNITCKRCIKIIKSGQR